MATTLDAEIEIANFDYVILIDVEGAELRVFEGCEKLISQKKNTICF
jgi:FkbM family methyltransferase